MMKDMSNGREYEPEVFELDVEPIDLRNIHIVGCVNDPRVLDVRESEPFTIPKGIMDSFNEFQECTNF